MASTKAYMTLVFDRSNSPNSLPRGTAWMPSSPPVKGACKAKKNTIWASASVIMVR